MKDIYEEIVNLRKAGRSGALCTIVRTAGSTPGKENFKMLVTEDGSTVGSVGGGCVEAEIWHAAREVMRTETSQLLAFHLTEQDEEPNGLVCGGTVEVFIEPLVAPMVFVFGAGHVSGHLAGFLKTLGFRTTIVEDREQFANRKRFPDADEILVGEYAEVLPKLTIVPANLLVIVTRGHAHDQEVLEWAVATPARYVGLIGSKSKRGRIYGNLKAKGVSAERIAQVHCPIGEAIHAQTAEEIALSIAAQLVKVRRQPQPPAEPAPKAAQIDTKQS